jgi:hypothetical protein
MVSISLSGSRLVDFQIEDIDVGELLEQDALAFHDRLGSQRADRPEAEDGRAVGDDADEIGARRQRAGFGRIGDDFLAGEGDARRIRHRQIVLIGQLLDRRDGDLARSGMAVIVERCLAQLLGIHLCLRFVS